MKVKVSQCGKDVSGLSYDQIKGRVGLYECPPQQDKFPWVGYVLIAPGPVSLYIGEDRLEALMESMWVHRRFVESKKSVCVEFSN